MKKNFYLWALCLFTTPLLFGQQSFPPEEVITGTFLGETMPLRDYALQEITNANDPKNQIMW